MKNLTQFLIVSILLLSCKKKNNAPEPTKNIFLGIYYNVDSIKQTLEITEKKVFFDGLEFNYRIIDNTILDTEANYDKNYNTYLQNNHSFGVGEYLMYNVEIIGKQKKTIKFKKNA